MQRLPIRSITLHAIGAMLVTVGIAICALVIVLLSLEAQPIDITVWAAMRALCAYCVFLAVLATIALVGAGGVMVTHLLISGALSARKRGVR